MRIRNFGFRVWVLAVLLSAFWFLPSALVGQTLSAPGFTFPSTLLNASAATQTATLTNNTIAAMSSISVSVTTNSTEYSVTTGWAGPSSGANCGTTLASGATCTITVTFTPTSLGARNGVVTISWTGTVLSPMYLYLSGWGASFTQPLPYEVYTTPATASHASVTATTMVTPTVQTMYRFSSYLTQTIVGSGSTCTTGNATVVVNLVYQDPNAASAQTVALATYTAGTAAGTIGVVPWTSGPTNWNFVSAASQAVQFSTTYTNGTNCTNGPTVKVYPALEAF